MQLFLNNGQIIPSKSAVVASTSSSPSPSNKSNKKRKRRHLGKYTRVCPNCSVEVNKPICPDCNVTTRTKCPFCLLTIVNMATHLTRHHPNADLTPYIQLQLDSKIQSYCPQCKEPSITGTKLSKIKH